MSVNVTIKVSGIGELIRDYTKFRKDMRDNMVVPLDESAVKYLKVIHVNFNNRGKTFGDPWPPLSPATIAEKRRLTAQGRSIAINKPLVRTGRLERGFGRQSKKSTNESYVYNTQSYAIVHQEGATVSYHGRNVKVPRRVLAEVDDERIKMVTAVFTNWFNKIVSKNSL